MTTTRSFTYTGQIETFTVPAGVTSLTIEAKGAEGANGGSTYGPGKGAIITGTISVTPGQSLKIIVGQHEAQVNSGGGGSFVVTSTNMPLVIAGGGGGSGNLNDSNAKHGQVGTSGGAGAGGGGAGGINGADGTNGGGGYSGGGGIGVPGVGGGGGSFNAGTTLSAVGGANSGNGLVTITYALPTQPIRYVKAGGTGNGTSWDDASGDLQAMINAAGVEQVWVAGGIYYPTSATDRNVSFRLKNGVSIYGGFVGSEQQFSQRPVLNTNANSPSTSILSGDIGIKGDQSDNSYHVIDNTDSNLNGTALLDGFVISGGNATAAVVKGGGGLILYNGSPRLNQCSFQTNSAGTGGAIFINGGNSVLTNCSFTNNSAVSVGGAIFTGGGGAIFTGGGDPMLTNCSFQGNTAKFGGGLYSNDDNPVLTNCSFQGNSATNGGFGGGIFNNADANEILRLINCSFQGNSAVGGGGGALRNNGSQIALTNCVLFSNGSQAISGMTVTASYSLFESTVGGYIGANNRTTDVSPFVSATDLRLTACSSAIDAGDNAANVTPTDLAGNARKVRTIDLGAYEFQGTFNQPVAITRQPASSSSVCAGSTVSVNVAASGTSPTYQWYKDGTSLTGNASATSATLTLTNVQIGDAGSYSVVVSGSCPGSVTSTAFSLTVSPLVVITSQSQSATAICSSGNTTGSFRVGFTGTGTDVNSTVTLFRDNTQLRQTSGNTATLIEFGGIPLQTGNYQIVVTSTCNSVTTTFAPITVSPPPTVSIVPSALTGCAGTLITLSAQGADRYVWNTGATTTSIPVTATGTGVYSVTGTVTSTGCSATASQSITIYPLPAAPTLLTQTGQRYPGGQSSVTVDVNSGNVNLVVSGCNGSINWSGSGGSSGTSSPIVVPTDRVGRFVYMTTCTSAQGCTSPSASATVIVQGRLTVLHRDVDNYADNNAIQPLLVLQNQGSSALPLSRLALRYYLTVEGSSALSNLFVNYAQVGNGNVRLRYVPLVPAQPGAAGYVEVSFTAGAGSLAAGTSSGPIQAYFAKGDYGSLFEPDDYSYNPVRDQLTATQRITAYYDGVLIAGIEPGSGAQARSLRALTESRNGPSATQINTVLEVRNEGTVAINYSELRARYYFTSDGNGRLQVEVDEGNVSTQLVALPQPVSGANYYLEIRYNQGGQLVPGASTGAIRYRISKPDGGRFDQTNDYSYQEQPQERSQNSRVPVYVGQELVWGSPPSGSARIASPEPGTQLEVILLGNPVREVVSVQIKSVGAEPLQLQLVSAQGRVIATRQVATPQAIEQQELSVAGQGTGVLLLQVSTPTQSRTIRVLKAE